MSTENFVLELYLKEVKRFPLLSAQRERKLILRSQQGDQRAREELITSNLRLVISIAKNYINSGLSLTDLIGEGNVGLMMAIERFNLEKGNRFSTYATTWIKHSIYRAITEKKDLIRIPTYMKSILYKYKKQNIDLGSGHNDSTSNILKSLDIRSSQKELFYHALRTSEAISNSQSIQTESSFYNDIEDKKNNNDQFFLKNELEKVIDMLNTIEPRRAKIIKLRYGLQNNPKLSLKEIAFLFSISKERVRQIEKETLKLLKEWLEKDFE